MREQMLTQLKRIVGILITHIFLTTSAFAGGIYLSEIGTPISVGTAGVGNVTNTVGADSVYTNPAGMTGIKIDQVVAGTQLVLPSIRFDSDIATAGGSDGGNAGFVSAIPSAFGVKTLGEDWRFGLGLTAPLGGGVDYGDDFVGRYHAHRSVLAGLSISPAAAYRVNDKLSLGVGVSVIYSQLDLDIAVNQPGPLTDGEVSIDKIDDWGYQGYLGMTYEATDRLVIGALYRAESDAELDGDLGVNTTILNELTSQLDKAEVDFTYPQLIHIGMRYKLQDDLMLLADFDWEDWSEYGDTRIGVSGGGIPVVKTFDRDWDDTWHLGLALVHRLEEGHYMSGGVSYDSSPVSDSKRTADLPVDEQVRLSVGYGKEFTGEHDYGFALGATYLWLGNGKMDQVAQGERYKGEFSTNHILFLSATLKFLF